MASELLTENGLLPQHPHAVLLTQVRDEPLQLPPQRAPSSIDTDTILSWAVSLLQVAN